MGIISSDNDLSKCAQDHSLRLDVSFFNGKKEMSDFIKISKLTFVDLRQYIIKIRNGKNTAETGYSFKPTPYIYLTVNNIKDGHLDFSDILYLNENVGKEFENSKLNNGDIIITRSGTVGVSCIFKEENEQSFYIPSGYLTIIRVKEEKIDPAFLMQYLNCSLMKKFFETYSCGKDTQNISQQSIKKIPFPDISKEEQHEFSVKLQAKDEQISDSRKNIFDTQGVIEDVFCNLFDYIPSNDFIAEELKFFDLEVNKVANRKYIRLGVRYNFFWEHYGGYLFKSKKNYETVKIRSLMKVLRTKILKKGYLDKDYVLIDKEDVEPKTGLIVNEEKVNRIDSDKVLFGSCDLLISKIDPFLGHVILNDKSQPYIGTTEFVPFKINDNMVYSEFLQYVFLSKNFLRISIEIMAGKRQPRITPYELLNLKIPLPSKDEQKKAIEQITSKRGNIKQKLLKLNQLIEEKDLFFLNYLKGM